MLTLITSRDVAEMRSQGFKRMTDTESWLECDADAYGIAPHSNPFLRAYERNHAHTADMAQRMRRAIPMSRTSVAAQYQPTPAERRRINDELFRLAYGRKTRTADILRLVSAVHGALSHALSADAPAITGKSHSGRCVRMVGRYALVLDWYDGALESAYLS